MRIELVYALPQTQEQMVLELAPGSTVLDAIEASGLRQRLPQVEIVRAGVWGRPVRTPGCATAIGWRSIGL